jgi:hypothetical protein
VTHLTFALAAVELMRIAGAPRPGLAGCALALALFVWFLQRMRRLFPDRPRSPIALHFVEEPFFAHWCAALGSSIPSQADAIVKIRDLAALGRRAVPSTFALAACAGARHPLWGVFIRRRWVLIREPSSCCRVASRVDGYRVAHSPTSHRRLTPARCRSERWAKRSNAAARTSSSSPATWCRDGVDSTTTSARIIGSLRAEGRRVRLDGPTFMATANRSSPLAGEGRHHAAQRGTTVTRKSAALRGDRRPWTRRADLGRALEQREPGAFTLLLSHDPALFPAAAKQGISLVLSGHTHGGQVALPFFPKLVSLGKLAHRFHLGLYRDGDSTLYVHPGLGTTGPPIRVGVAPEIAILTLRAA